MKTAALKTQAHLSQQRTDNSGLSPALSPAKADVCPPGQRQDRCGAGPLMCSRVLPFLNWCSCKGYPVSTHHTPGLGGTSSQGSRLQGAMPGELAPWSPTPAQASARGRGPRLGTHTVTGEGRHTSHWGPMVLGQPTSRPAPGGRDLVSVLKPRPQGDLCRGNGMWLQAGSEGTRLLPCSLDQQLRGAPAALSVTRHCSSSLQEPT